eukprot:673910-Rhodomonas_salina.1
MAGGVGCGCQQWQRVVTVSGSGPQCRWRAARQRDGRLPGEHEGVGVVEWRVLVGVGRGGGCAVRVMAHSSVEHDTVSLVRPERVKR